MMELTCRRLASVKYFNYLRQGDYGFIIVCLSVSSFVQKLSNRFAWHFQRTLAMNKWLNFGADSDHHLDTGIVFLFIIVGRYGVLKFCFVLFLVSVDVNNAGCMLRWAVKCAERSACAVKVAVPSCWHTTSRHLVHHCRQFIETDRPQLPLLPMIMIVQMMSLTRVRSHVPRFVIDVSQQNAVYVDFPLTGCHKYAVSHYSLCIPLEIQSIIVT